jgi:hypothetical protein
MKIGFSLPNIGPIGTVEAITKVVQRPSYVFNSGHPRLKGSLGADYHWPRCRG